MTLTSLDTRTKRLMATDGVSISIKRKKIKA